MPIGATANFPLRQLCDNAVLDQSLGTGQNVAMLIYKIFRADEWAQLQAVGITQGAPIDLADGFIHFSSAQTVARTAELYFAGVEGLQLVAVEAEGLDALKWEASRGGEMFPHLFRDLTLADVIWSRPLPIVDGVHQFGDLA